MTFTESFTASTESSYDASSESFVAPSPKAALVDTVSSAAEPQRADTARPEKPDAAAAANGFDALKLPAELVRALRDAGYTEPTDVQNAAIPPALAGIDVRVSSATGSGKTASFALPALARVLAARAQGKRREKGIVHGPRALVLVPTRELAMQVSKAIVGYGRHIPGLRVATVVGGVPYGAQLKALRGPLDILIATPGRLMDHMTNGQAVLENVEVLVLDEADRMLDLGFIDDIRFIAECLPAARQTMMYSATFAGHVGRLASELLNPQAQTVAVAHHTDAHDHIEQRLMWADDSRHKHALLDHILTERELQQAVVFTSTQRDADWLADRLADQGHAVASLHGAMPQGRRNRVLQGLRNGHLRVLVATDVAARGIDVPNISHVINYGLPMKAEDYVHRIGRTGRAGRQGLAITLAEAPEAGMIRRIQQFTTQQIPVATIVGLEPTKPSPRLHMGAPRGAGPGTGFGAGGHRGGPRTHAPRRDGAPWAQRANGGRGGDDFHPARARDGAGFDRGPREGAGFHGSARDGAGFHARSQDGAGHPRAAAPRPGAPGRSGGARPQGAGAPRPYAKGRR